MRCLKGQLFKVQLCEDNERYNWDIFAHQTKGVGLTQQAQIGREPR